jgi:hypothetical protein
MYLGHVPLTCFTKEKVLPDASPSQRNLRSSKNHQNYGRSGFALSLVTIINVRRRGTKTLRDDHPLRSNTPGFAVVTKVAATTYTGRPKRASRCSACWFSR